jgi:Ni/Fe-hydrogenase 1 B-type cytochrome subunit
MYVYKTLSAGGRFCHWLIAGCMAVLFSTGLYIGNPAFIGTQGTEPAVAVTQLFSMETIRYIHFAAAFVFSGTLLLRLYLVFTHPGNRLFPDFCSAGYWRGLVEVMAYYAFLRRHHQLYIRNPLAATAYLGIYLLMLAEAVTGLAMYSMIKPNSWLAGLFGPVNNWLGNEYMTHFVHHVIAWGFFLFLLGHVYLVFYNDIVEKSGELSSIVSGRKLFTEKPADAQAGLRTETESM